MGAGTLFFALLHLVWYTRVVAYRLWELSGGIRQNGLLTEYGSSKWAWTVPLHVPAGLAGFDGIGLLLLFAGSIAAGFGIMAILEGIVSGRRAWLGSKHWRLWLFLAGWCWIPVPAVISWIYQWTVRY
jgi:hypothetical protein